MNIFQTNKTFRDYSLLFFLTLVVFWPLTFNFLSLKNDALAIFLPFRYHISEAIRHGYFPFWSPYLYTGFPIHADIQGEVWNPLVWLLSFISKYDMTILQWEVLIYLFLSAVAMYRLIKYLGLSRITALCCSIAFMSCGYMTDSISIIPWISSAAFIPFILMYFLRSLKSLELSDTIKLSISLSLMFLCGYPSFFIYLNYIIGISFLLWFFYQIKNGNTKPALKVFAYLTIAYFFFLLICSPAIISYYEFLPYYPRGTGLDYHKPGENPLVPYSFITYLLPNIASKANFLATDLSMRNTYVGAFIFIFFLSSLKKLNRFKIIILIFTVFSFLFSLGDLVPTQKITDRFLPMMNMFRHPGTIRIFTSIGMIVMAAYSLDIFIKKQTEKETKWFGFLCLALLLFAGIYFIVTTPEQAGSFNAGLNSSALKRLLHSISFQQFALAICLIQFLFISLFLMFLQRKNFSQRIFIILFLLDSIVFAWIGLPFTVVSQYKTSEVNSYVHSFPTGYPMPGMDAPIESEVISDFIQISPHGYHNFYNKKITIQDYIITPTLNFDYGQFLADKKLRSQLKGHPFAYVSNDSVSIQPAAIKLLNFTPNHFIFQVNSLAAGKFQLFQQFNQNWQALVNHKPAEIKKSNIAFMSVNVPAGTSFVEWKYEPQRVYVAMILSLLSLLAVVFYFIFKRKADKIYD